MTATRARACTGKVGYRGRWRADEASRARQAFGAAGWAVEVYRCRFCDRWHIGHRRPRRGDRRPGR